MVGQHVDITWVEIIPCGFVNRWILQDENVSIVKRLRHLEHVQSSVACFAGDIWNVSTLISGSCAGQLSALRLAQPGGLNDTKYFINGMFGGTNLSIEPTSKHGRASIV